MPRCPPAAPACPAESCPPDVLNGKRALGGERVVAHEPCGFALGAESEILELHEVDHGIIIIGLQEVHIGRADARLRVKIVPVHRPAAAHLDRIVREGVMPLDSPQDAREGKAAPSRLVLAHDEEAFRSRAGHDAIEEPKRISNEARAEIGLEGQRLLDQGVGIGEGVCPLRDAKPSEILRLSAVDPHVVGGQEREAPIGPPCAKRIDRIARETAEIGEVLAEGVDVVGVPGDAGDDVRIPGLYRARGAAKGDDCACPAHRDVVEPPRRETEMLCQADRCVREQREARNAQTVDLGPWKVLRCP